MFTYRFEGLQFSGGEEIPVEADSLLILVGPNNSGKSRALRDIETLWKGGAAPEAVRVVAATSVARSHAWEEFKTWIRAHYRVQPARNNQERFMAVGGALDLPANYAPPDWTVYPDFRRFVVSRLDTESRLKLSAPPGRIDPFEDQPQHFIHLLQASAPLLDRVQREVRAAFRLDLALDYMGGAEIPAFVGDAPAMRRGWNPVHPDYARAMRRQMIPLQEAGDGVRSYVVTLASALVEAQPVLLIDEPEAFLHPPQARRLGKLLGELARERSRQIIVATHSSDFVRGALTSSGRVAVCRIERERSGPGQSVNHGYPLGADDLRALWQKPLLRSSHAIDGLFHRGVVVCESDGDARFYEAVLMRMEERGALSEPADLHFVHGGGKAELHTLAGSYTALHVPVAVTADFDILREEADLRRVVTAVGGDFATIQREYRIASSALAQAAPIRNEEDALRAVETLIAAVRAKPQAEATLRITGRDRRDIEAALEEAKTWSEAKRYGLRRLRGAQRKAGEQLLRGLAGMGVYLVPSGELESWDETLPAGQKEVWIREALQKLSDDPASFNEATDFVRGFARFLGIE